MTNSPTDKDNPLAAYAAAQDAARAPKPVLRGKDSAMDIYVGGKNDMHANRPGLSWSTNPDAAHPMIESFHGLTWGGFGSIGSDGIGKGYNKGGGSW